MMNDRRADDDLDQDANDEKSRADEGDDAVFAADDTGMVRNEADIVAVEEDLPQAEDSAGDA